jgi:hypothetical protein
MTVEFPRTTYARAVREYDEEFKRHLVSEIVTEIAEASIVTDPDVRIRELRVGETLEALTTCLIATASLSPHFEVPSYLRAFAEDPAKRVRRDVAKARAEGGLGSDFVCGARRQGGSA